MKPLSCLLLVRMRGTAVIEMRWGERLLIAKLSVGPNVVLELLGFIYFSTVLERFISACLLNLAFEWAVLNGAPATEKKMEIPT